jgi:hypothetical protein
MAARTVEQPDLPAGERSIVIAQKRRVARQMETVAFGKTCFRDALLGYFGEAKVAPGRPLALRILDWVFASRRDRPEKGICCDVCHDRAKVARDHRRFIGEALGVPMPETPSGPKVRGTA